VFCFLTLTKQAFQALNIPSITTRLQLLSFVLVLSQVDLPLIIPLGSLKMESVDDEFA